MTNEHKGYSLNEPVEPMSSEQFDALIKDIRRDDERRIKKRRDIKKIEEYLAKNFRGYL